jgi:hypothetical protein
MCLGMVVGRCLSKVCWVEWLTSSTFRQARLTGVPHENESIAHRNPLILQKLVKVRDFCCYDILLSVFQVLVD